MKSLVFLIMLMPIVGLSQKTRVNEYDRFNKQLRISLQPVRIMSADKANVSLAYNAMGSTLYVEMIGTDWGAFAIDEGQDLIFLLDNDSTVTVKSTAVQTAEMTASFQTTYKHSYFIKVPGIMSMSENEVVGIRKYGLGDHVDMKVSPENALKIKKLSVNFIEELKAAKVIRVLQNIKLSDIAKHIGDSVRFCSKVYNTRYFESSPNKPTMLDVSDSYSSLVNVVIWQQDRKNFFNSPENLYNKKDVCVTGVVQLHNNMPQIVIRSREQIAVRTPIMLSEIDKFVGDSITVTGKIITAKLVSTSPNSPTLLNLGADYPNQSLTLVIGNKERENFSSPPETYFINKEVSVTGKVELYNGKPQIVILNKNQIIVTPGQPDSILNQPEKLVEVDNSVKPAADGSASVNRNKGIEKSARFPGGQEELLKFLQTNLVSPRDALDMGEKKIVVAKFLINPDGTAANIQITKAGGTDFDKEVIRVLKLMPKWEPQISNGKPVAVNVTQPITFVRQESDSGYKAK